MQLFNHTKSICFVALLFFISGCSLDGTLDIGQGTNSSNDKNPIILSLSQGFVADTVLHLRVQLEFLDTVSADSIYVQLKGLKDGVVQEEQTLPVANFTDDSILKLGNKLYLPFTLGVKEIDRFTLACSWGEAGYKLARQLDLIDVPDNSSTNNDPQGLTAPVRIAELKISEIALPCDSNICSVRVNLEGRVIRGNRSTAVKSVALAYKLIYVPDGEVPSMVMPTEGANSAELSPDEKILPFGDEVLPKEGFEFSVIGDKDLPKIPGGRFMPVVRVLRYESVVSID